MNDSTKNDDHSWLTEASTESDEVAEYYDGWADEYDKTLDEWDYKAPIEAANLLRGRVQPDAKILDAGCGTGLTGSALKTAGFTNLTGTDISQKSLPFAERTGAYTRVLQQDLQELPFPFETDEFDAINCIGVLSYIKDARAVFEEFCRIVRPGGHIVFSHREDLIEPYQYPQTMKSLEEEGSWKHILTSDPKPYLPQNEDFTDKISVVFFLYEVL